MKGYWGLFYIGHVSKPRNSLKIEIIGGEYITVIKNVSNERKIRVIITEATSSTYW